MPKRKIFVLDTNVLIHDPQAIFAFEDNDVVIPIVVIEELDDHKKGVEEKNRNAREVSRILDDLRRVGKLYEGVKLPNGGTLRVELNHQTVQLMPSDLVRTKNDNRIVAVAVNLQDEEVKRAEKERRPVILVTKDNNMRIKADALRLIAEDYRKDKVANIDELFTGVKNLTMSEDDVARLYESGAPVPDGTTVCPNEFAVITSQGGISQPALGIYDAGKKMFVPIKPKEKMAAWGVTAKNTEQLFALQALLDDNIRLVTLVGKAGTGKTLLALAAGMERCIETRAFSRLVVSRPVFPLGKDIGFLPGDVEEKLRPWMQPIRDNLDFLMGTSKADSSKAKGKKDLQGLFDLGMIEVEPLAYIRGRSMPNQFLIVDEAQNLTPHEVKTIITRAGEGTKVVLTGDPYQIDNPYIDSGSNGLSNVVERFKGEQIASHITLTKGERSELAELAATLL